MVTPAGAGRQGAAANRAHAHPRDAGAASNARGARAPAVGQSAREIARLADSIREKRSDSRVRERGMDADKGSAKERPTAVPVRLTPSRERERERCARQPLLYCDLHAVPDSNGTRIFHVADVDMSMLHTLCSTDLTAADASLCGCWDREPAKLKRHGPAPKSPPPLRRREPDYAIKLSTRPLTALERDYNDVIDRYPCLYVSADFAKIIFAWVQVNAPLSKESRLCNT